MKKVISIHRGQPDHWSANASRPQPVPLRAPGPDRHPVPAPRYAAPEAFAPSEQPRGVGQHPAIAASRPSPSLIKAGWNIVTRPETTDDRPR